MSPNAEEDMLTVEPWSLLKEKVNIYYCLTNFLLLLLLTISLEHLIVFVLF